MKAGKRIRNVIPWAVERTAPVNVMGYQSRLTAVNTREDQRTLYRLVSKLGPCRMLRDVKYSGTVCK